MFSSITSTAFEPTVPARVVSQRSSLQQLPEWLQAEETSEAIIINVPLGLTRPVHTLVSTVSVTTLGVKQVTLWQCGCRALPVELHRAVAVLCL